MIRSVAALAFVAALLAPAAALAADPAVVSGTVTRAGTPVVGVNVVIMVTGQDMPVRATTDDTGTFRAELEAVVGDEVTMSVTLPTETTELGDGCHRDDAVGGQAAITLETLNPEPVSLQVAAQVGVIVCAETARPVTPPSSDAAPVPTRTGTPGGGLIPVLLGLAGVMGAALTLVRRRA